MRQYTERRAFGLTYVTCVDCLLSGLLTACIMQAVTEKETTKEYHNNIICECLSTRQYSTEYRLLRLLCCRVLEYSGSSGCSVTCDSNNLLPRMQ
jgi:hypothetical protein